MRTLTVAMAFVMAASATAAAAPKGAPKPSSKSEASPASADLENPYSEPKPAQAATRPKADEPKPDDKASEEKDGNGAAPKGETEAKGEAQAPRSGDAKLDAPPTAAGGRGPTEPPLSPLNPEADEFPSGKPAAAPPGLDALLGDIAALRGRVAALATSLYSSKLRVSVETDGDQARIDRLIVTLDDGVIFASPGSFVAEDAKVVYEHAVAPGDHVLGVEVERHDARNKAYRSHQATRVSVDVPDTRLLEIEVLLEDDSDIAEDFPDDQDGEYELGVQLSVRVAD